MAELQDKERILKAAREKQEVPYKGAPIRLATDFSMETLQARRECQKIIQVMRNRGLQPRLLYWAWLSIKIQGQIRSFQDKERILKAAREKQEVTYKGAPKVSNWLLNGNAPSQKRMAKNIPSTENQRPANKTTLPSKALNQDRRPNKEFPRQKKSKRIYLHQTSSARDAKGTALRKEGKEKERGTQVGKNGNE